MVGATPDFADIDSTDYTLSPEALTDSWRDDVRAVMKTLRPVLREQLAAPLAGAEAGATE